MNQIKISITDRRRSISGIVHTGFGQIVAAALTAEPETLPELENAIRRFVTPQSDWPALHFLGRGEDMQPFGDGILAIDLAARTLLAESTGESFGRQGTVLIETADDAYFPLLYELCGEWTIVSNAADFNSRRRRAFSSRTKTPKIDHRQIIFGLPLAEFIAARAASPTPGKGSNHAVQVHTEWLTSPNSALGKRTPREILLEKQHFIDMDLQSRALQWSMSKVEPPPLPVESFAYRFAGFGSHSFIVHFDYFRFMFKTAVSKKMYDADELWAAGQRWLASPCGDFSGRVPNEILEAERRRTNIVVKSQEVPYDDNCELCRLMAADFDTPMFWHLDGSSMEYDRFEFSNFKSRREWEADQRRFREFVGRL